MSKYLRDYAVNPVKSQRAIELVEGEYKRDGKEKEIGGEEFEAAVKAKYILLGGLVNEKTAVESESTEGQPTTSRGRVTKKSKEEMSNI